MFCNTCGSALASFDTTCARCGTAIIRPLPTAFSAHSASSYGFWKFLAGFQIAMGLLLCIFLGFAWNHLREPVRSVVIVAICVALPMGYALWERARWGLYLLTVVFTVELCNLAIRLSSSRPRVGPLAVLIHGIMMFYFWSRRRDFR